MSPVSCGRLDITAAALASFEEASRRLFGEGGRKGKQRLEEHPIDVEWRRVGVRAVLSFGRAGAESGCLLRPVLFNLFI